MGHVTEKFLVKTNKNKYRISQFIITTIADSPYSAAKQQLNVEKAKDIATRLDLQYKQAIESRIQTGVSLEGIRVQLVNLRDGYKISDFDFSSRFSIKIRNLIRSVFCSFFNPCFIPLI
jgi:hypothetical protein